MEKYDRNGINKKTYDLLTENGIFLFESEYGTKENLFIIRAIENYTKEIDNITKMFDKDINFAYFNYDDYKKTHEFNIIGESPISFKLLSESIENIPKEMKEDLESSIREGKCHKQSLVISLFLDPSKILTGIIKLDNRYFLHSVVEYTNSELETVQIIDYTRNLIIEKQKYIKIFGFDILNEVESKYLLQDLENLRKCGLQDMSLKMFLTFRDEIMSNLEKNKFLIKTDKILKKGFNGKSKL